MVAKTGTLDLCDHTALLWMEIGLVYFGFSARITWLDVRDTSRAIH